VTTCSHNVSLCIICDSEMCWYYKHGAVTLVLIVDAVVAAAAVVIITI